MNFAARNPARRCVRNTYRGPYRGVEYRTEEEDVPAARRFVDRVDTNRRPKAYMHMGPYRGEASSQNKLAALADAGQSETPPLPAEDYERRFLGAAPETDQIRLHAPGQAMDDSLTAGDHFTNSDSSDETCVITSQMLERMLKVILMVCILVLAFMIYDLKFRPASLMVLYTSAPCKQEGEK